MIFKLLDARFKPEEITVDPCPHHQDNDQDNIE